MGRNNADFQGEPSINHTKSRPGWADGEDLHTISLDIPGKQLSRVSYLKNPEDSGISIDHFASLEEGKGHVQTLLHKLYSSNPGHIYWGDLEHPASEHLFKKFSKQYGRSSFRDVDY